MSIEFLKTDFDKVSYLLNLLTARATGMFCDPNEYEALRYELLSNENLAPRLPQWLNQHPYLDSFWVFIKSKFKNYAERRTYLSEQFTPLLDSLELDQQIALEFEPQNALEFEPQNALEFEPQNEPEPMRQSRRVSRRLPVTRNKRKVFIVHGRDNEAKQEVSRFIEKLELEAIILHEQASSGMTIIEKIEKFSTDADFALVLYTACDLGRGVHESKIPAKNRARQNVVFEHGYLMAKLGRENVCALVKGDIETPNDISGVVYVELDSHGAWKIEIEKELKACGYTIN